MAQMFRKAILTTAAVAGFASMSLAEEPIKTNPVEIVKVSVHEDAEEKNATRLVLIGFGLFVGLGVGSCLYNKLRTKKEDDYEEY